MSGTTFNGSSVPPTSGNWNRSYTFSGAQNGPGKGGSASGLGQGDSVVGDNPQPAQSANIGGVPLGGA